LKKIKSFQLQTQLVWQTIIQAPLVIASGAIGFAQYLAFLTPVNGLQQKMVSGGLVILVTILLYRKINDVGKIAQVMQFVVLGTIAWIIVSGLLHIQPGPFLPAGASFTSSGTFFSGLGMAGTKAIYCYLGYYNVCHLGAEIKNPQKNIPRSIFISIAVIASLYLLMQVSVLHVIPWREAKDSTFIISLFFEKLQGHGAAQFATLLVLLIAVSSLFAVMLGYSRVPYAAAVDGNFFAVFGKLHPVKNFPHISLLVLGVLAFVFSLLLKMQEVITAIIVMRILIQFIAQSAGIIAYHRMKKTELFPYRMWLYPLPPVLAILIWLFIFFSADAFYIAGALGFIAVGIILFFIKERAIRKTLW
jgi:amino acid transporter